MCRSGVAAIEKIFDGVLNISELAEISGQGSWRIIFQSNTKFIFEGVDSAACEFNRKWKKHLRLLFLKTDNMFGIRFNNKDVRTHNMQKEDKRRFLP